MRTTDWPWSMESGSAVIVAVGGAAEEVGAMAVMGVAAGFLWQPVTARIEMVSPNTARVQTSAGRVVMTFSFSDQTVEMIGCNFNSVPHPRCYNIVRR